MPNKLGWIYVCHYVTSSLCHIFNQGHVWIAGRPLKHTRYTSVLQNMQNETCHLLSPFTKTCTDYLRKDVTSRSLGVFICLSKICNPLLSKNVSASFKLGPETGIFTVSEVPTAAWTVAVLRHVLQM